MKTGDGSPRLHARANAGVFAIGVIATPNRSPMTRADALLIDLGLDELGQVSQ
ncbi:hypothetical protein ACO2RV_20070 [Ancylobacter sp. VNQ12]|uniref:hypothetical protein n=1 Tax=Ancylobacter sp. VNQ12 TaxID=3400920 RepID=UPI003C0A6109